MKAKQPENLKEMNSFRDYLQVQRRNSDNMIICYVRYADKFLSHVKKEPKNITKNDIQKWQLKMNEKYCKKSLTVVYSAVNKYIDYLIDKNKNKHLIQPNGKLWKIDIQPVKSPMVEPLTKDEVRRIFRVAETDKTFEEWRRLRNIALLKTLYYAIPRKAELINMDVEHINLNNNTLRLFDVKNDEWRNIPIDTHCIEAIKDYLEVREPKDEEVRALFLSNLGIRIGYNDIIKTISYYCTKAKITRRVYPHLWRHTGISHLAEVGWNSFQIRELSRHRTSQVLDTYIQIADKQRIEIASSLSRNIEDDTPKKPQPPKPKTPEPQETDTYIAKPQKQVVETQPSIHRYSDNKDLYIQFLEERLNKTTQKTNRVDNYIQ